MDDYRAQRDEMVRRQLAARGIREPVLGAMGEIPRHRFVPPDQREVAYFDGPLPIGEGQTISQPYIVALMIQALDPQPDDRMLEIGAGSGYAAAVLSRLVAQVYAVERVESLYRNARRLLADLGYDKVEMILGDGSRGWPDAAPYDGIVVAAGAPTVPDALREQLTIGGRLVIPVGSHRYLQRLVRVTRESDDEWDESFMADVRFVPLIGDGGWRGD